MNPIFSSTKIFSELKRSLRISLPLVISEVIYAISAFVATIMIAHLGKVQLAANSLVWNIYLTGLLFFIGILTSVSIMTAQSFGAQDEKGIALCFKQGLIMAIIFAVPMMILMWYAPIILVWTGQNAEVIECARPFFYALIYTILPINLLVIIQQFLIGITKTRSVMLLNFLAVPIEIFFYYAFLFGKFGLPKLGLAGIGYGFVVSNCLVGVCFIIYLAVAKDFKKYQLYTNWWVINRKFLYELMRIGSPLGVMYCIEVAFFAVLAIMMGRLGTNALAAYQIANQYMMIVFAVIFALGQGVTVRIGNEVGQNNRDALGLVNLVNIAIALSFVIIFSVFYIAFPHLAISIDLDIHAPSLQPLVREAARFLNAVSFLIIFDCVRLISFGALRGLKDTRFPVLISAIGFWCIGFSCAYLFAFKLGFGGVGIWWGLVIGIMFAATALFIRFRHIAKTIDLVSLVTKS